MTGALSDQRLDDIQDRANFCRAGCEASMATAGMIAEIRRLREQRGHLTSAFDKLGDQMGELVQAARSERERYTAQNQRLRAELDDVAGYLAAIHRHASRHDVLGANLGCAGCELLGRIEGEQ